MYRSPPMAPIIPQPISRKRYHTGIFVLQHLVFPPTRNHPITGMFSYHLSCLPQAQWLLPVIGSFLGTLSITTPRNEPMDAPMKKASKTRVIRSKVNIMMFLISV